MENLSHYLVKNQKQITHYLKTLATEKCLIAAGFGEKNSFLTAILELDEKKQLITIDCGPKEYLNKELLSLGIVHCTADFNGIKVSFEGRSVKKSGSAGQPSLSIKIPDQLYWVQRRQFYRVRSPLSKDSYCSISYRSPDIEKPICFDLKLFNLSISGFCIQGENIEQIKKMPLDTKFTNCTLMLDGTEKHNISFIPRNLTAINPSNQKKGYRVGCEFVDLTPRTENAFSRYMQAIEREIKKNFD